MGDTRADIYYAKGKRRILIVDDELINREILKFILEEDYEPLTAEDGESALEIIRAYGEDLSLILLDLLMPGMHGLEVLQIMQDDPVMKKIRKRFIWGCERSYRGLRSASHGKEKQYSGFFDIGHRRSGTGHSCGGQSGCPALLMQSDRAAAPPF